jgi:hypothetical protein
MFDTDFIIIIVAAVIAVSAVGCAKKLPTEVDPGQDTTQVDPK